MSEGVGDPYLRSRVIDTATEAGRVVMGYYGSSGDTRFKSDGSPVTDADLASHDVITSRLAELTPTIPVRSEEAEPSDLSRPQSGRIWVVDPLDGTKEFLARNGEFTVNIALVEDGSPRWGVVHAPALDVVWEGGRALGARRTEGQQTRPLQVEPRIPGEPWRVVCSRSHMSSETEDWCRSLGAHELQAVGSSIKICLVAEGRAHVYPRLEGTSEWDTAAAHAVLEGAGGESTELDGSPVMYGKPNPRNPWFVARAQPHPRQFCGA